MHLEVIINETIAASGGGGPSLELSVAGMRMKRGYSR
jgi:hypothetical protein